MTEDRPDGPRWWLPAPAMLVLAIAFWAGIGTLRDFDIWWHLAAGKEIVETAIIPRTDHWSHTVDGKPWFAHEWLAEIFFYGVWRAAGENGLLVWKALMGLFTLMTLGRLFALADPRRGLGHIAGLLAATVCVHYHLLERPHMFTNLFLALEVLALEEWSRGGRDRLGWLPPLFLLWANLHGGVVIGLAVLAMYGLGIALDAAAGREGSASALRRLVRIGALCLAACLFNPRGLWLLVYPLKYAGHGTLAAEITEWTSPDFREFRPMEGLLLALAALALFARFGARPSEALFVLAGLHLFLQSKRNIVFVALFLLPVAVDRLARLSAGWRLSGAFERTARAGGGGLVLAAFVFALSCHVVFVQQPRISPGYFPDETVEYLRSRAPGEVRMLNEFVFGGYFIWKLQGRHRVFIDSRTDMYFDENVFAEYLAVFKLAMGWRLVLDKRKIDLCVFELGHPLSTVLATTGQWRQVHRDASSEVWERLRPATGGSS
ncbi:MAG: hypothetical protein HY816_02215 [Candidatus Wallbacteria bacterium]|nr:hypothetical protein [Candidatus Wallbacteria bacterium]